MLDKKKFPFKIKVSFPPSFHAAIMVHINVLANALKGINNAKKERQCRVLIEPCSRVILRSLTA